MSDEAERSDDDLIASGKRAFRELPDAPDAMIRRAEAIAPRAPGLLTRIRALMSTDSWVTPLPGLRSARNQARQLLFTTPARDFEVRVAFVGGTWNLEGQVLGPADGGSLSIRTDGTPVLLVELDELGAFVVDGLAAGRYELVFYFATDRIELPELDLGAQDLP